MKKYEKRLEEMDNLPDQPLPLAVYLYRNLQVVEEAEGRFRVQVPDCWDKDRLECALEKRNLLGFSPADVRQLTIEVAGIKGRFALNLERLLARKDYLFEPPENFYLVDIDYLHPDESERLPAIVEHYFDAAEVADILLSVADYSHKSNSGVLELVFMYQTKLEVSVEFTPENLCALGESRTWLRQFLGDEGHEAQKKLFVKSALVEMHKGNRLISLGELLPRLRELTNLVEENFKLYISDFSFQKMKDELRRQKLEFVQKLNSAFSSIQNQLLAVPAALLLAGTQMNVVEGVSGKNLLILGGFLVFCALMSLMVRNQMSSIDAIKLEIDGQKDQMKQEHPMMTDALSGAFDELYCQHGRQRRVLRIVDALVASSLAVITGSVVWGAFVCYG